MASQSWLGGEEESLEIPEWGVDDPGPRRQGWSKIWPVSDVQGMGERGGAFVEGGEGETSIRLGEVSAREGEASNHPGESRVSDPFSRPPSELKKKKGEPAGSF